MENEIILKFKADNESLNNSFKDLETKANKIETEISNTFKTIAKESGGALDPFTKDLEDLVKDIPRLKELAKIMIENAKSLDKNSEEFKTLNKLTKEFAANVSELEKTKGTLKGVSDNIGKATESTKSLRTQMREAQLEVATLSEKFGGTSREAIEAAKRAAVLKDTIGDAKSLTDAFNPDAKFRSLSASVSGVVGGFQAYEGALALIGVESEDLQKTLVKLNALMALSGGLQALGEAQDSFKQLKAVALETFNGIRAAIGSTGIGLLVIALGAIVAYWDDIKEAVTGVSGKVKENADLAKKDLEIQDKKLSSLNDQDEILKAQGLSERRILEIKRDQLKLIYEKKKADLNAIVEVERAELESTKRRRDSLFKYLGIYGQVFSGLDFFNVNKAKEDLAKVESESAASLLKLENQIAGYNNNIKELDKKELDKRKKDNEREIKENENKLKEITAQNKKYFEDLGKENILLGRVSFALSEKEIQKNLKDLSDQFKKEAEISGGISIPLDEKQIAKNMEALSKGFGGGFQTAEEFRKQQFEEDKAMIMELSTFAQNGLLLQLGLDPQSVERVKATLSKALDTFNKEFEDIEQQNRERFQAMAMVTASAIGAIGGAFLNQEKQRLQEQSEALNAQQEEELRLAGDNEQKKDVIRQKYDLKRKELKRKEAEADKRKAIFDAIIGTAVAVIKALPNFVLAAIAGGLGAAQIALIAAQPIPKFEKGGQVKDGLLNGKPHSAGGIHLEAEGGEYIINKRQTKNNLGLIEAVNMSDADRDKYINGHYILPALKQQESEFKKQEQARMIEIESLIASRIANNTLKGIHSELKETTNAVRSLKGKGDIKW